jgi:DNA-binding CsgD family transcriptional regulator
VAGGIDGRQEEFDQAVAVLRDRTGLLLIGPAGVGKSHLADELAGWAAAFGYSVVRVRATAGSAELPLGAFMNQLATTERLFTPMYAEIRDRIKTRAEGRPILIDIDDVDLLDDTSAVLVHQMVTAGDAQLLGTLRSGHLPPAEISDLSQRGELVRLDVEPLQRTNAAMVADSVSGQPLDAASQDRLWTLARGNALFIRELVIAAQEAGHTTDTVNGLALADLPLDAPRLVDIVRARLGHLDPVLHRALLHLAFAEPCGPAELASVADADALATLERLELVTVGVEQNRLSIRLDHPLFGEVLRAGTPLLQRRAILGTLARDLLATGARRRADVVKLARLAVDGGVDIDVDILIRAAGIAVSIDRVLCERIARKAFDSTDRFAAGWDLANCLCAIGDLEAAREHLANWQSRAVTPRHHLNVVLVQAQLDYWVARDEAAAITALDRTLDAYRAESDSDDRTRAIDELLVNRALLEVASGRSEQAWATTRPLLDRPPDQTLVRAALAASHALLMMGRGDDAVELLHRVGTSLAELGDDVAMMGDRILVQSRSLAYALLGRVDEAHADMVRARDVAVGDAQIGLSFLLSAVFEVLQGRPVAARAAVDSASTTSITNTVGTAARWLHSVSSLVEATAGDVDDARTALVSFDGDDHPAHMFDFYVLVARARLSVAAGFPEEARQHARDGAQAMREINDVSSEAFCLYELVRLDRAEEVVVRFEDVAKRAQGELIATMAAHARALVDDDPASLAVVTDRFMAMSLHLYASEAAAQAAAGAQRVGDQRMAARHMQRAAEQRARCDSVVSSVPVVDAGPVSLTRREREIALLAAQGLPSREIGERLYISRRTAENHLAKVYDKYGIRTRAELSRLLDGGMAALAS